MALAPHKAQAGKALWPFYIVLILFTGFCGFHLLWEIQETYTRYHHGLSATGTVRTIRNERNTDAAWTAYDVSFKSADGQTHTITNHNAAVDSPPLYQAGQAVRVVYLPEDADDGRIDSDHEKYGVVIGLLTMFLIGLSILAFVFFVTRRPNSVSRAMGADGDY